MAESTVTESPLMELLSADSVQYLFKQIEEISPLLARLVKEDSWLKKVALLDSVQGVQDFFKSRPCFSKLLSSMPILEQYLIKALVVIRQGEVVFSLEDQQILKEKKRIFSIIEDLKKVESFYNAIGGVIGYHLVSIKLLCDLQSPTKVESKERYYPPFGIDLTQESQYLREVIVAGIAHQRDMAELYPVGGAADRLKLQDEKTHFDLPAARLEFLGRTLLEGMIRDLQAREYLHFKVFHKQVTTPVALMTSHEKNNDHLVQEIVKEKNYFGRSEESFKFFSQPLVPTFTKEGTWCLRGPMELLLKPGGHGVLWKLALEEKVLEWVESHGRKKALIRQINNPIAGVDLGLIALSGIGCKENKVFGFASCLRRVKTSEGMNILKEIPVQEGATKIVLSNVEYCDFKKYGIQDIPAQEGEPYSIFPSNTNILFVDLPSIAEVIKKWPYPGMLVNFKKMRYYRPGEGEMVSQVARLELLMQNIADGIGDVFAKNLEEDPRPDLRTFITFNKRCKTISPTKKQFVPGSGLVETALGCFYDYLKNARALLVEECLFLLPELPREEDFLQEGPSFIILYHPALGPLYSVIRQKITRGSLARNSELQLEIADIKIENLHVEGSLLVEAFQVMGHYVEGKIVYSHQTGRCLLKNVKIRNKGIDRSKKNVYWKNSIQRKESCHIQLEGFSEFVAEDITLEGNHSIVVKDGERVIAKQKGDEVVFYRETIDKTCAQSFWNYTIASDSKIELSS